MDNKKLKDDMISIIQDCHINFLIGSGLSMPYLSTLGNVEVLLTELSNSEKYSANEKNQIKALVLKKFFEDVIFKNINIVNGSKEEEYIDVTTNYDTFLRNVNLILVHRKSSLLNKQVNLFTTNIDVFIEKSIERLNLEVNDGFNGRFKPRFGLTNFKKSLFKNSLHYDVPSEIPVFNLLKIHGSLTWELEDKEIYFSNLSQVQKIKDISFPEYEKVKDIEEFNVESIKSKANIKDEKPSKECIDFLTEYEKLSIVNPTKQKFQDTILNMTYYEMLRIYTNSLEKENSVLFIMGFSFADEHIKDLTLRMANSNPTLIIYIVAYNKEAKDNISEKLSFESIKNDNVKFIVPSQKDEGGSLIDEFCYDLENINKKIVVPLFKSIVK